jgi:hypothetical protein
VVETVWGVDNRSLQAKLLPSAFFSSFVGRARPGNLHAGSIAERAPSWASWAISSVVEMSGMTERTYVALLLDGRFHDPKGTGPQVRPHLEIPARRLAKADPEFAERLALMGNALSFPWWVVSEVTAVRRALFNTPDTPITDLIEVLEHHGEPLRSALMDAMANVGVRWDVIEGLLVHGSEELGADAAGDFSAAEVAEYFPGGAGMHLEVSYDAKLRERHGAWSARRVGVWQITGIDSSGERFGIGVVTPRLTANSLFKDPLFDPATESPAALLVRGLLLRRLARKYLLVPIGASVGAPATEEEGPKARLRVVVAQPGKKLPEASMRAAVHFLQSHPDGEEAWDSLERFARKTNALLTVTREGFISAHRNALRYLRRAEEVERDDINIILPLGWDEKSRVVRFTYSLPIDEDAHDGSE